MREIRTDVDIEAPPETVWSVLTDLEAYGEWNPHITRATGALEVGSSLEIDVDRIGAKPRTMTVTVTDLEAPRRLEWVGSVGFGVVFEGRHTFELTPVDGDRTRLLNRELVSGLVGPFAVTDEPERDYARMNEALKERIEGRE